jgi:hypothetical protein
VPAPSPSPRTIPDNCPPPSSALSKLNLKSIVAAPAAPGWTATSAAMAQMAALIPIVDIALRSLPRAPVGACASGERRGNELVVR